MDCLTGVVKEPEDRDTREKGILMAYSVECNISAMGTTKEEAAEKLADLLRFHLTATNQKGINPYTFNEEALEELMLYCTCGVIPEALPDIDLAGGLRLRCYDLSD